MDWQFYVVCGNKFLQFEMTEISGGNYFLRFSVQVAENLSGRNLNMVFSTFILRYVESKFTLLTYLMENNTVITVISYCTKGLNNSKTKQKPIPTIHNKSIKSRVFNLTESS